MCACDQCGVQQKFVASKSEASMSELTNAKLVGGRSCCTESFSNRNALKSLGLTIVLGEWTYSFNKLLKIISNVWAWSDQCNKSVTHGQSDRWKSSPQYTVSVDLFYTSYFDLSNKTFHCRKFRYTMQSVQQNSLTLREEELKCINTNCKVIF